VKQIINAVQSAIQAVQALLNTAQSALQAAGLGDSVLAKGVGVAQTGARGAGNIAGAYESAVDGVDDKLNKAAESNQRMQDTIENVGR
jgi:hypothetical protein